MQTYLFYDIETTGLNKSFDQILQFAAIRTDLHFKEIERYELKVKLNPDTVPSPRALITHQISLHEIKNASKELDAIKQIHTWLNATGTISLGYNTLGFDDEFLRFSFYRNLLSPYTHQYSNQCSRMDLYPIAVLYSLFKKDIIEWPSIDGQLTLKLEHINTANQFAPGAAHNAMVDVEVTLALAKRLSQAHEMWNFVLGYFNKKIDKERCEQLPCDFKTSLGNHQHGLVVDGIFGGKQYYQCPAIFIGEHTIYKNQSLWLRLDTPLLQTTTDDNIAETTWVIRKKWGEPSFILPPKERFLTMLSSERQVLAEKNKKWLQENPERFKQIVTYHRQYVYPTYPNIDIQAGLYLNGFWSKDEEYACTRFHTTTPHEKAKLVGTMQNEILQTLAIRILGRHYPDTLNEHQLKLFSDYLKKITIANEVMVDYRGEKKLSPQAALDDIHELRKADLTSSQKNLLDELEQYLGEHFMQAN